MPSMPLEAFHAARFGATDHGYSCGQGDPAPITGMVALALPRPFGRDYGEDEELKGEGLGLGTRT
jgi:hypothetical protein